MGSLPARSAMVRASFNTRWNARAESCNWRMAESMMGKIDVLVTPIFEFFPAISPKKENKA
jgi:hypothetical protein